MFNDIVIGPITLHMYGLMIAIGFIMALFVCTKRSPKLGLDPEICWGIFYGAIIGGLLGTRLLYYIVSIPQIIEDPSILWDFSHGYVVYGGIIGGILAGYIYTKLIKKVDFLAYFDLVMPSVAMAQGFGRIGCFFAGCCYGAETDAWYGITFPVNSLAPAGVKLIPTQIISSLGDFAFFGLLILYASKNKVKGRVASAYLLLYGIGRFVIEFFRNDYRGSIGFLSTSQIISIAIVAIGIVMYLVMPKLQGKDNAIADEA